MKRLEKIRKEADRCFQYSWKNFRLIFFCQKNLRRDILILSALLVSIAIFFLSDFGILKWPSHQEEAVILPDPASEEEKRLEKERLEIADIQSRFDISNWKTYQNNWYGFSLKYPETWSGPLVRRPSRGDLWEQKLIFSRKEIPEGDPFAGFAVVIYDTRRAKELSATAEFPKIQEGEGNIDGCRSLDGHLIETGDYPAEEIYVPSDDRCFLATLFFTNTREDYIYNIIPVFKGENTVLIGDPALEIKFRIPEFFVIAGSWELIDIRRPKPIVQKTVPDAPFPVSFKRVDGRLVCAKKNDHPSKSGKKKGKHLDMECCLDPDEYPNPHCYYPPEKYGKLLKK